jgi:nuclear pore complex protein Nup107
LPEGTIADRVSKRVEAFAVEVDKWATTIEHVGETVDQETFHKKRRALSKDFLAKLSDLSEKDLKTLKNAQRSGGADALSKSWRQRLDEVSNSRQGSILGQQDTEDTQDDLKDLHQAEEETNTWHLLMGILDLRFPTPDVAETKEAFMKSRGDLTPYSSGTDLWERFIFMDDSAREKKIILKWLEECATSADTDFDTIVEQLQEKAGTNEGTWSRGWLHTREKIKAAKRLGAPLDDIPNPPNNGPLVSKLDPDVAFRENGTLDRADEYYERSLWLACFAMMRRGKSWSEIREWFEDRNEGWRAASMGFACDEQAARTFVGDGSAGAFFRRMCYAASRNSTADKYERAVYGLLAGDLHSVEPVCRSWDDYLYAKYNALLLAAFERWIQNHFPDRLPKSLTQRFSLPAPLESQTNAQVIESLSRKQSAGTKTTTKKLQATVIAHTFEDFVFQLGVAMSDRANDGIHDTPLIEPTTHKSRKDLLDILEDYNTLRLVVHVLIVWEAIAGRLHTKDIEDRYIVENVFVYYMDSLRKMGKIDIIPTYAALISEERRSIAMGVILSDITKRKDQMELVELMSQGGFDLPEATSTQVKWALVKSELQPFQLEPITSFEILEPTQLPRWPGQRIKKDFIPILVSDADERVLRAAEWYNYISSPWKITFDDLSQIMKAFLRKCFTISNLSMC